tara:strand:+ start:297 stop:563 length:267 start_codon:yes stop_codon:yes gene_type:complete
MEIFRHKLSGELLGTKNGFIVEKKKNGKSIALCYCLTENFKVKKSNTKRKYFRIKFDRFFRSYCIEKALCQIENLTPIDKKSLQKSGS